MSVSDPTIRSYVYSHFVHKQSAPTAAEAAQALEVSPAEIEAAYRRLDAAHLLVLEPGTTVIRWAQPFCATPTPFRVYAQERAWWGTCAWDALGIAAALGGEARVVSTCPDCHEPLTLTVKEGQVSGQAEVIHFAVPARRWWDDIFFT